MKAYLDNRQRTHDPKFFMENGARKPNPEVPARVDILKAGAEFMLTQMSNEELLKVVALDIDRAGS